MKKNNRISTYVNHWIDISLKKLKMQVKNGLGAQYHKKIQKTLIYDRWISFNQW